MGRGLKTGFHRGSILMFAEYFSDFLWNVVSWLSSWGYPFLDLPFGGFGSIASGRLRTVARADRKGVPAYFWEQILV